MASIYRIVNAPLSAYVDFLWAADGYIQPHPQEFVLPTGNMTLVIDLDVQRGDAALIYGARSLPLILDTSRPLRLIAAHFRVGGGFAFVDGPAGDLHNVRVPLAAFWRSETAELRERVLEAQTDRERFHVLECFLARRLHANRPFNPAVRYAIRQFQCSGPECSVGTVTTQVGMSAQRFIETFRSEVGLAPKVFARLARFQRAVDRIDMSAEIDWADIAVANGYYDQSHFIRDFRRFAGVSPSWYLHHRTSRNHVRTAD